MTVTPVSIEVSPGTYDITAALDGYVTQTKRVLVTEGANAAVAFTMVEEDSGATDNSISISNFTSERRIVRIYASSDLEDGNYLEEVFVGPGGDAASFSSDDYPAVNGPYTIKVWDDLYWLGLIHDRGDLLRVIAWDSATATSEVQFDQIADKMTLKVNTDVDAVVRWRPDSYTSLTGWATLGTVKGGEQGTFSIPRPSCVLGVVPTFLVSIDDTDDIYKNQDSTVNWVGDDTATVSYVLEKLESDGLQDKIEIFVIMIVVAIVGIALISVAGIFNK